jgi:heme oxygenase
MKTEIDGAGSGAPAGGPASAALRAGTAAEHQAVDDAFARFGLATAEDYRAFLTAHARILSAVERAVRPSELVPGWTARTPALIADLAELGVVAPASDEFRLPEGGAARWGALYVLEGSRLGGAVLERRVAPGLPRAYLGARHPQGAWRGILDSLDRADAGPDWRGQALAGAKATFAAFLEAARA